MNWIDNILDRVTMYRLVLYYVLALLLFGIIFGAVGVLSYSPLDIVF